LRLPVCNMDSVGDAGTGCSDDKQCKGDARSAMDTVRIHEALRDLDTCVRDCTRRQLSGQQYLETSIRENLKHVGKQTGDQLKKHIADQLQEKLKALSSSWKLAELSEQLQERLAASADRVPRESRAPSEGFRIGERVRAAVDRKLHSGQISRGDIGVVQGPCLGDDSKKICVDFPHLKGVNLLPSEITKETEQGTSQSSSKPADSSTGNAATDSGRRGSATGKPPVQAPNGTSAGSSSSQDGGADSRRVTVDVSSAQAVDGAPTAVVKRQSSLSSSSSRDRGAGIRQVTIDARPPEVANVPEVKKQSFTNFIQSFRDSDCSSRMVTVGARSSQASLGSADDLHDPLIQGDPGASAGSVSQKLLTTLPACLLEV